MTPEAALPQTVDRHPCPACDERRAEAMVVAVRVRKTVRIRLRCLKCEILWWVTDRDDVDERRTDGRTE